MIVYYKLTHCSLEVHALYSSVRSTPVTTEGTSGKERVNGGGGSTEDTEQGDRKKE